MKTRQKKVEGFHAHAAFLVHMKRIFAVVAVLSLNTLPAFGQQVPPLKRIQPPVASLPQESPLPDTLWSTPISAFTFSGGTLDDLARELKPLATGFDDIETSAGSAKVPPFALKESNLAYLLNTVQLLMKKTGTLEAKAAIKNAGDNALTVLKLSYTPSRINPSDHYLPQVDFKGGTGTELAETIKSFGMDWDNIHVSSDAAEVQIPPFHVEHIGFSELGEILASLTDRRINLSWSGTFLKIDAYPKPVLIAGQIETAILPLQFLLNENGHSIEDVNALVQIALKMRADHLGTPMAEPTMSLHRDTETLIVVGDKEQVAVVREVVKTLESQRKKSEPAPRQP